MADETLRHEDPDALPRSEGPGTRIGPYLLVRRIGEGGFGDVYEAEQSEPVKRRVALKILKLGMDTREVIARFDLERQALAVMEHPHIAHVIDAGATRSGRPYFVMEYVEGIPISEYCAARKLPVDAILRLFAQVCGAVQHAHTKGLIHRDLKPGNVLVADGDDGPFAKVIDFGIAKATSGELSQRTHATRIDQVMGTPLYMSPEQARGDADIDTRTDIYSLGVIAYELLTGTTPVEREKLASVSLVDTQRLICESEPPRPSQRVLSKSSTLSGSATFRAAEPRKLAHTLRGDLDWIVMKALEKEPARRYQTAAEFAIDVQRFLDGQPVLAAPPSRAYRFGKFVRRHKAGVVGGTLAAVSLIAGIIAFGWQAHVAQQRADELKQVADFQAAMLGKIDPTRLGKALSDDVTAKFGMTLDKDKLPAAEHARQASAFAAQWERINATDVATGLMDDTILRPAAATIERQFKGQPLVAASLRQALADSYVAIGLNDRALPLQSSALAIRRRLLGDTAPDTLASMEAMGELLYAQGKADAAESLFRNVLATRTRILGESDRATLESMADLGMVLDAQGKFDQAERIVRQALDKRRQVFGPDDKDTIGSIKLMAGVLIDQGKPKLAEPLLRDALAKSRRVLGEDDPATLAAINDLGAAEMMLGNPKAAEPYFREAWEKHRRLQGEDHPDTLQSLANLGGVLMVEDKTADAEPILRMAIEKCRKVLGTDDSTTLLAIAALGKVLLDEGKFAEAERLLSPSVSDARRVVGDASPPQFGFFMLVLGKARAAQHEFASAESALLEAHVSFAKAAGDPHGTYPEMCVQALVDLYDAWDKTEPGKGYAAKAKSWKAKMAAPTTKQKAG